MSTWKRDVLLKGISNYLVRGRLSIVNIGYNAGSTLGLMLGLQIITGVLLSMNYQGSTSLANICINRIMREIGYGSIIRNMHLNGAFIYFMLIYLHIWRGLLYSSYLYPRNRVWIIGIIILVLSIVTAFMGYCLPWGQMSYWGAQVITNLLTAIPYIGKEILIWIWGGYSVENPTLNRLYSMHFLLPIIIAVLVITHLIVLHNKGGSNPIGINTLDTISFNPYYIK